MWGLRPLSLGELLDQSLRLYRRNFWHVIALALATQFPITLLQMVQYVLNPAAGTISADSAVSATTIIPYAIGYLEWLFLYNGLTLGTLVILFSNLYLDRPTRLADVYWRLAQNWRRLLSNSFCDLAVVVVLAIWTLVPVVGWLTGPGMLFFFNLIVVPLTVPVIVVETRSTVASVRRSWDIARRRFWPLLWAMMVVFLLSLALYSGTGAVFEALLGLLRPSTTVAALGIGQEIPLMLFGWVLSALTSPVEAAAIIVIYFDLRVRLEGLDLSLAAADRGEHKDLNNWPTPDSLALPLEPLISRQEFGRFGLLTFGAAVFLVVVLAAYIVPALAVAIVTRPPG